MMQNQTWGGVFNKKIRVFLLILIAFFSVIGISYAYWLVTVNQSGYNVAQVSCFKVSLTNESDAINLQKTYPISDEEGLKETGYSFTIKNTCDTYAAYQVNLEDILDDEITKRLSNKYIKISLNDSTPRVLSNYTKVNTTIDKADASFKLTSGSLAPSGEDGDSIDYTLKLWLDYDTPPIEEVMNATFKSKISVTASHINEKDLINEITIAYSSKNVNYTNESETVVITANSANYNLIEYSTDNITYTPLDIPSKEINITKMYTEEKEEKIYFRDELGNIKWKNIILDKLDQTGPIISVVKDSNNVTLTFKDEKSGLAGYQISEEGIEPTNYQDLSGNEATITQTLVTNKNYDIYAKDVLGNVTKTNFKIDIIDTTPPEIISLSEQDNYGQTSLITATVKDTESGLVGYAFTESNTEPTSWVSINNIITTATYTYEASKNGTIYFWVKDGANNVTNKTITVSKVDNEKPKVTISLASKDEWKQSKTLSMSFKDADSGLAGYQINNSSSVAPTSWESLSGKDSTKEAEITQNGYYCIWVKDNVGLTNHDCMIISKIDTQKPTAVINVTVYDNTITIDASKSTDNSNSIVKYEYSIDGYNYFSSTTTRYNFTDLESGTYTIYLKVTDAAGNISNVAIKQNISITVAENALEKITALANDDYARLVLDTTDDRNLRYVSSSPNNYIYFNCDDYNNQTSSTCELWRIVGVMKNVLTADNESKNLLKIIRDKPLGKMTNSITNDYAKGNIKNILNTTYYNGSYDSNSIKNDITRNMIENVIWPLGGSTSITDAVSFYNNERGTTVYNTNQSSVEQKIGLMYISDYAYATSGGSTSRNTCLTTNLDNWSNYSNCYKNNWLYNSSLGGDYQWTLSSYSSDWYGTFGIPNSGVVSRVNTQTASGDANPYNVVTPTLYLDDTLNIVGGNGSSTTPYKLNTKQTVDNRATTKIINLAQIDTTNLAYDNTPDNNLRYIGSNPNNYVSFDGDLWRIIGVMNNVGGIKEQRIKLVKYENITSGSWDSGRENNQAYRVNNDKGTNEWSTSDIRKLLNGAYLNSTEGKIYTIEHYCLQGQCNNSSQYPTIDFTNNGMKAELKELIDDAIWNTGAQYWNSEENGLAINLYNAERGSVTGKVCTSGQYCNDTLTRTTVWTGKVGLIYPSDYLYATSGGSTTSRETCLNTSAYNLGWSNLSDCIGNDWIENGWTMTPGASEGGAGNVFVVLGANLYAHAAVMTNNFRPTVYLKPNVKIVSGTGTQEDPFILGEGE